MFFLVDGSRVASNYASKIRGAEFCEAGLPSGPNAILIDERRPEGDDLAIQPSNIGYGSGNMNAILYYHPSQ